MSLCLTDLFEFARRDEVTDWLPVYVPDDAYVPEVVRDSPSYLKVGNASRLAKDAAEVLADVFGEKTLTNGGVVRFADNGAWKHGPHREGLIDLFRQFFEGDDQSTTPAILLVGQYGVTLNHVVKDFGVSVEDEAVNPRLIPWDGHHRINFLPGARSLKIDGRAILLEGVEQEKLGDKVLPWVRIRHGVLPGGGSAFAVFQHDFGAVGDSVQHRYVRDNGIYPAFHRHVIRDELGRVVYSLLPFFSWFRFRPWEIAQGKVINAWFEHVLFRLDGTNAWPVAVTIRSGDALQFSSIPEVHRAVCDAIRGVAA